MTKKSKKRGDVVPPPAVTRRVDPADIMIGEEFGQIDQDVVTGLAESFKEVGVMHPPTVFIKKPEIKGFSAEEVHLVSGQHRVEAAKKLGWEFIDVFVVKRIKKRNRKQQITENVHRKALTDFEQGELIKEWIKLRREGGQDAPPQPNDKGIKSAARMFGKSPKTIRRKLEAADLHPDAKKALKLGGLARNGAVIAEVAGVALDAQAAKAAEVVERRKHEAERKTRKKDETVSPPTQPTDDNDDWSGSAFDDLKEAWEKSSAMKRAWESADLDDRQRFIAEVLLADEDEEESAE